MTSWKFPLSLSYDSEGVVDGQGAQLLRIVSLFSICRFFKLRYQHNPISRVINSEDRRSEKELEFSSREELEFFNSLVNFPTDKPPKRKKGTRLVVIKDLSRRNLLSFVLKSLFMREHLIVSVAIPQAVTDKWPRILNASQEELKKNLTSFRKNVLNAPEIAIHVRTNYNLFRMSNLSPGTYRRKTLTPNYYDYALEDIENSPQRYGLSELEVVRRIHIHTDLYDSDLIESKGDEKLQIYANWFCDVSTSEGVNLFHQAPVIPTFLDWVFARVFVMSTSSLSYVAGLLNQNCVIYPRGHGHSKLIRWKVLDEIDQ